MNTWRICGTAEKPRVINVSSGAIYNVLPCHVLELEQYSDGTGYSMYWDFRGFSPRDKLTKNVGIIDLDDVHVDVTGKCNMACKHCYQSCGSDNRELSLEVFETLCENASKNGGARIALSGGEALLHTRFRDLPGIIEKHGMVFCALFSNGFDPDLAFELSRPHTQLLFSHSPMLGQGLSQEKIRKIGSQKGKRMVTISTITIDGSDLDDVMKDVVELSKVSTNRIRWRIGAVRSVGRGLDVPIRLDLIRKKYDELFDIWDKEIRESDLFDFQIGFAFRSDFVKYGRMDLYTNESSCCEYKKSSIVAKWDGMLYPCTMDDKPIGSVSDFNTIVKNIETIGYRSRCSNNIKECSECNLRNICNGGCRLCTSGDECDQVSRMTYDFLNQILPRLRELGVKS